MRGSIIVGLLLVCAGAFVLIRGASYKSEHDLVKVGDVKVTAKESKSIPPWAGIVAIAAGGIVMLTGIRRRA